MSDQDHLSPFDDAADSDETHPLVNVPVERSKRTCLRCGKPFTSRGPDHRVCPGCRRSLGDHRQPFVYSTELKDDIK